MPTQVMSRSRPSQIKRLVDYCVVAAQHVLMLIAISLATILLIEIEMSSWTLGGNNDASLSAWQQIIEMP